MEKWKDREKKRHRGRYIQNDREMERQVHTDGQRGETEREKQSVI